jgi:hypothetical protein
MLQFFGKTLKKLHEVERDERGFTLIELMVVISKTVPTPSRAGAKLSGSSKSPKTASTLRSLSDCAFGSSWTNARRLA